MNFNEALSKVVDFVDEEWVTIDLLLGAMREDISLQILRTTPEESQKRDELYYTAKAIDAFEIKLQGCINECKSNQGDA